MSPMQGTLWRCASVAALALFTAWAAAAQNPSPPATEGQTMLPPQRTVPTPGKKAQTPSSASGTSRALIPNRADTQILAKELLGASVVTRDGVEVGTVEDLILDRDGLVSGIVISTGGFLGLGRKSVGISAAAMEIESRRNREVVVVKIASVDIENAPPLRTKKGN